MGLRFSFIRLVSAGGLVCAALMGASPALAGATQGQAEVAVLRRLAFINVDDMLFGNMLAGTTAGTVVIAPNGTRTRTGGVILMNGVHQPATFSGWGSNGQTVQISMSANSYTLTRVGGTQTMVMDTFIIGSTPTAQLTTAPRVFRINSNNGLFTFPVGATLRVGANQTPGTYRGTMTITLNYQ